LVAFGEINFALSSDSTIFNSSHLLGIFRRFSFPAWKKKNKKKHLNFNFIHPNKNPPTAYPKNPPTVKCLFRKSTKLQLIYAVAGGFPDQALRSWWAYGTSTLQSVEFPNKHSE